MAGLTNPDVFTGIRQALWSAPCLGLRAALWGQQNDGMLILSVDCVQVSLATDFSASEMFEQQRLRHRGIGHLA